MPTREELQQRMDAALGRVPCDRVIRSVKRVSVYSGEIREDDIGIKGGRFACVGTLPEGAVGESTRVIDAGGDYAVPGLIDAHFHMGGTHQGVADLTRSLFRRGTTTIASDCQEYYVVAGKEGVRWALDEADRVGLRVLYQLPIHMFMVREQGTSGEPMRLEPLLEMLEWPETNGLMEPPAQYLIAGDEEALELVARARRTGKIFTGHAVGVDAAGYDAYRGIGATSCHESQTAEEALDKLRHGIKPFMRHGSASPDMPRLLSMLDQDPSRSRWASLCSDEVDPVDMDTRGGMDHKIRTAVEEGVDPLDALRMATVNPAEYYRVDDELGSITAGKVADLVLTESLEEFRPHTVLVGGEIRVKDGESVGTVNRSTPPDSVIGKVRLRGALGPEDFHLPSERDTDEVRVRVIGLEDGSLVSSQREARLPVKQGNVVSDPSRDVLKVAVVDRHRASGRRGLSFASGLGIKRGAVATTYCHPFYQMLITGSSDAEMARAGNLLREVGGGIAVVGPSTTRTWELSLVGTYTPEPLSAVREDFQAINRAIRDLGCELSAPILALSFLALPTIPEYGLTDLGLYDALQEKFVDPLPGE